MFAIFNVLGIKRERAVMNLTKRMQAIVDICPMCDTVADIGSDHGLVPIALIREGKAKKAIAADISEKSLQKAKYNLQKYRMEDSVELRTGDGLSILRPEEAQLILITGLGGQQIADMVLKGKRAIGDDTILIVSPNQAAGFLRETLAKNGFETLQEDLVREKEKFYPVILLKRGTPKDRTFLEYEFGKLTIEKRHPVLKAFVAKRIQDAEKMEKTACAAEGEEARAAYIQAKKRLKEYGRLMEWL